MKNKPQTNPVSVKLSDIPPGVPFVLQSELLELPNPHKYALEKQWKYPSTRAIRERLDPDTSKVKQYGEESKLVGITLRDEVVVFLVDSVKQNVYQVVTNLGVQERLRKEIIADNEKQDKETKDRKEQDMFDKRVVSFLWGTASMFAVWVVHHVIVFGIN